ncbi:hypothetical protein EDM68_02710 [Candidatus Uhrbacteria bacterium]|nr:MAG: hypothetical protein EDM68_02710 [Candidatus Uhrbacteria bacterium]
MTDNRPLRFRAYLGIVSPLRQEKNARVAQVVTRRKLRMQASPPNCKAVGGERHNKILQGRVAQVVRASH